MCGGASRGPTIPPPVGAMHGGGGPVGARTGPGSGGSPDESGGDAASPPPAVTYARCVTRNDLPRPLLLLFGLFLLFQSEHPRAVARIATVAIAVAGPRCAIRHIERDTAAMRRTVNSQSREPCVPFGAHGGNHSLSRVGSSFVLFRSPSAWTHRRLSAMALSGFG